MNYDKHYCIEVTHQYGVKTFKCDSFWDAASDELSYFEYADMQSAVDYFGDPEDVPAELAELLQSGPVIEITARDDAEYFLLETFDKERYGLEELAHDLNRLIVIDNETQARKIAESYEGHEWMAVRAAARKIIENNRDL